MSSTPQGSPRQLPEHPDLRHLKDQAKDLLKSGSSDVACQGTIADCPAVWLCELAQAQSPHRIIANGRAAQAGYRRQRLRAGQATDDSQPGAASRPLGYGKNGPLTWVAECRVPREAPGEARLAMARWMIENGSDVHQGGDGPLMRAALADTRIPMMELLVDHGADVNALWDGRYPIICAVRDAGALALKWLLEHGAGPHVASRDYGSPLSMLICTYTRNAKGKNACLEVLADAGFDLPDTPAMAFHRGRIDLLEAHLDRDPSLLERRFQESEIFPAELGIKPGDGLHVTPVAGSTLLHLAIEYDDIDVARWLIDEEPT